MTRVLSVSKRNACSDGSLPDPENCDGSCTAGGSLCPNGTEYWKLSGVAVPIAKGVGELCLNAGVGIIRGAGTVVQIGVDAAVLDGAAPCCEDMLSSCGLRKSFATTVVAALDAFTGSTNIRHHQGSLSESLHERGT
jgi:hypothetical protein